MLKLNWNFQLWELVGARLKLKKAFAGEYEKFLEQHNMTVCCGDVLIVYCGLCYVLLMYMPKMYYQRNETLDKCVLSLRDP